MEKYEAGTISKHGIELPVFVDEDGNWSVTHAGRYLHSGTKDGLAAQVGKLIKTATVKVNIPFTVLSRNAFRTAVGVRRGVATGIHSANGNVLARWDSGEAEQLGSVGHNYGTMGDLTPEQAAEWVRLDVAQQRAAQTLHDFERAHILSLTHAVKTAVDKAAEAADREASGDASGK